MSGFMRVRVWDVEHGCCVMLQHIENAGLTAQIPGRLAMIDSGSSATFKPSAYIKSLRRETLDYLFITNADQDHMSDLKGLEDAGINVSVLIRNPSYTGEQLRRIKLVSGPLTDDASWYAKACGDFSGGAPAIPFDQGMGGITCKMFWNPYPDFEDTNNLSLAVFIKYNDFKMLFPGDLEKPGWKALLQNPAFRSELAGTNVLMASHHGRESGFCEDIFQHFTPDCVVISDKAKVHKTQEMVPDYRRVVRENGAVVKTTGKRRHVLTTRRDGWIQFDADDCNYTIETEYLG